MDQIQQHIQTGQQLFNTQVWPQIETQLKTYNLPTTFEELRKDLYQMQRPFTHQYEQELEYFIKDNNITTIEFIILIVLGFIVIKKILSYLSCKKRVRLYRDVDDRTLGYFATIKRDVGSYFFQSLYNNIPFVRNYVDAKLKKAKQGFIKDFTKNFKNQHFQIPFKPMRIEKIQERLEQTYKEDEKITGNDRGQISGTRYAPSDVENKMKEFVKEYIFHNPLHASEFPGSRQMEAEVMKMTCKLYGSDKDYGITTNGGTESIMMAILAYRNYYQKKKGISKPNIVVPVSSHIAFNKACFYYNIEPIVVPTDKMGRVCLKAVKSAINKNTICLVANNPSYQDGAQDDIPALGKMALKHDIGLHVDACLGSFIMPFVKELGAKSIKDFDFKVPGVTSISCDHHKYGMAPKGISLCMFKHNYHRQAAYFSYSEWPGGLYATAQPAGSRSSAPIAGAWFAMMYHGIEGYKNNAKIVLKAVQQIRKVIEKELPELEILGNPECQVIAFTFKKGIKQSIYQLDNEMHNKGWTMNGLQKPNAVHVAMTYPFAKNVDNFIRDLKQSVKAIMDDPTLHASSTSGSVGLYGASSEIPDSITKEKALIEIVDVFTMLNYDQVNEKKNKTTEQQQQQSNKKQSKSKK